MKRILSLFLISFGVLYAEYNVNDTLTIPINAFYLIPIIDYVKSDPPPTGSNYKFYGKVRYKTDKYYIITIDTIKYDYSAGDPPQTITRTDIIPPDSIEHVVDSLVDVLESNNIFERVLDSLGVGQFNLFDSDNDPRIYIVVAAGFYLTSRNAELRIEDTDLKGYFDPYYSTSSAYPRHEFFVLNYKSKLFSIQEQANEPKIKKELLRNFLFYLYTQYVLWSINRNDNEDIADILRGSFYLASRIDGNNAAHYYKGFDLNDNLSGANFDPFSVNSSYLKAFYMMQTQDAIAGILWLSTLEDVLGYQTIKSFLLNKGQTFGSLLQTELQIRGISIDSLVVLFHLKNLLNRFGNSFPYHYNQPFLQNVPIYPPGTISSLSSFSSLTISPRGAFGLKALTAATARKPTIINYSDDAHRNGFVYVFKIDTVSKTIERVDTLNRVYLENGIFARDSQWLFVINLSSSPQTFYYGINDTIGPTINKFVMIPDQFALNVMHIYIRSSEILYSDITRGSLTLSLYYPNGFIDTFSVARTDSFNVGNIPNIYYNYDYIVPSLMAGKYILSTYRVNDGLDNKSQLYSDTVEIKYLNANAILSFNNNSIILINPTNNTYRIALNPENDGIILSSDQKFNLILKIKGYGIICKQGNECLETYKDGDYVYAYISDNGYYVLSSGKPSSNFKFTISNKLIYLNVDGIAKLDVYSVNGRKVYSTNLVSGVYELPLKPGLYKASLRYNNKSYEKVFVVY